jgi:hypothetical protein
LKTKKQNIDFYLRLSHWMIGIFKNKNI